MQLTERCGVFRNDHFLVTRWREDFIVVSVVLAAPTNAIAIVGCSSEEFQCRDASCIGIALKCDGYSDCHDGSDELDCGTLVRFYQ